MNNIHIFGVLTLYLWLCNETPSLGEIKLHLILVFPGTGDPWGYQRQGHCLEITKSKGGPSPGEKCFGAPEAQWNSLPPEQGQHQSYWCTAHRGCKRYRLVWGTPFFARHRMPEIPNPGKPRAALPLHSNISIACVFGNRNTWKLQSSFMGSW